MSTNRITLDTGIRLKSFVSSICYMDIYNDFLVSKYLRTVVQFILTHITLI